MLTRTLISTIILLILTVSHTFGQKRVLENGEKASLPVLEQIHLAYQNGDISLDQKVLYQLYAGENQQRLPEQFREGSDGPLKCGYPALMDYRHSKPRLQPQTIREAEALLQSPANSMHSIRSPSGKFEIRYDTEGTDAVPAGDSDNDGIPDYIEWIATAADSSWSAEIERLGFSDPVTGATDPYPIYVAKSSFFGFTDRGNRRDLEADTFIEINSNLDSPTFHQNEDPNQTRGAIRVTVAHELKHAIQFVMNHWSGESDFWAELDATLMEELVYDHVNDYYNYLRDSRSIFKSPDRSFYPGVTAPGSYFHVSWALYFAEKYGERFWTRVWKRIEEDTNLTMVEAITQELGGDPVDFTSAFTESLLWHLAAGPQYAPANFGFEERLEYPGPFIANRYTGRDSTGSLKTVSFFASNFFEVSPIGIEPGHVALRAEGISPPTGVGVVAYLKDGTASHLVKPANADGPTIIETPWAWNTVDRIGITVSNGDTQNSTGYSLTVFSSLPEELVITQNYPNPFNPETSIEFALPKATHIRLEVYDITGRLIRTLVDEQRPAGIYTETFNGNRLASGIYFYRLRTDNNSIVRKMTLIK